VSQRYKIYSIGAFWLTINMGVLILTLALVFGSVFHISMKEFLPFLSVGLILWTFVSGVVSDGAVAFISHEQTILQMPIPLFTYVLKIYFRNLIIFVHNIAIIPIVFAFFGINPDIYAVLSILGFLLLSLNLLWISLVLAIVCARYRDLPQIVQNLLQVVFYITPIIWMPSLISSKRHFFIEFNPAFHALTIVREPFIGLPTSMISWEVTAGSAFIGWMITILIYHFCRARIAYWV
jgi:lipopolysaccharide transport system permease protein